MRISKQLHDVFVGIAGRLGKSDARGQRHEHKVTVEGMAAKVIWDAWAGRMSQEQGVTTKTTYICWVRGRDVEDSTKKKNLGPKRVE